MTVMLHNGTHKTRPTLTTWLAAALTALTFVVAAPFEAAAQGQGAATTSTPQADQNQPLRVRLPELIVTPQKEEERAQEAPVSLSVVTGETIVEDGLRSVSEIGDRAPNVFFSEFSARKLSNARFRGVGASPANPAITTFIDGVPQLNAATSSIELLDIQQAEFVRGPQSALFGRNTLGGVINIASERPSLNDWRGSVVAPFGNFTMVDTRADVSGPIVPDRLGFGAAMGYSGREGFTTNTLTGNDLDSRSGTFGKAQLLWTPSTTWETRFIFTGERARDGDYALNDLPVVRSDPFSVQRDFEGHTHRDVVAPTFLVRWTGPAVSVWSTTGVVSWETDDDTDLDYTALPLATRNNNEQATQFTQEVRVASNTTKSLGSEVSVSWQAGVSFFTQGYDQDALNTYAPFLISPMIDFPLGEQTLASLDDRGFGIYGETTFLIGTRLEASVGVRGDFEHKEADITTSYSAPIADPNVVAAETDFDDVSPQFTVSYRAAPSAMVYGTVARGFKAGGYNPSSPLGNEPYGEEHSWSYEGGVKTLWLDDRLSANLSVFFIDWSDMQLNVPNDFQPGAFYIDNVAAATSKGMELEMMARVAAGCDLFGGIGFTDVTFGSDSFVGTNPVDGLRVPNAPRYTADVGGQYSMAVSSNATAFVRAEFTFRGSFFYDELNTTEQEAYALANFRVGVRGQRLFGEFWTRNAFDTEYVPLAFFYPFAASGFIGEPGAPRTFGVRAGYTF